MRRRYRSLVAQTLHYFSRPHDGVPDGPVGGPAAWRTDALDEDDWRIRLSPVEVGELDRAVEHAQRRGRPTRTMTRRDFPLGVLEQRIDPWRRVLQRGRGFLVLRGVPVERWSARETKLFFWGLGQHLGIPGAQNPQGDLLGDVRDQGHSDVEAVRAYRTNKDIRFHCDAADVVGLLCLETAAEGGRSRIASSVSVHDEIWRRRPDLAPRLYRPFELDTKAEGGVRHFPITPCRHYRGAVRTFYHADYFRSASRHPGVTPLNDDENALLDLYDELASSDELCLSMQLAAGDVQLLSNHTHVHARSAYQDGDSSKRHLLRLWLSLPDEQRRPPELRARTAASKVALGAALLRERIRQR